MDSRGVRVEARFVPTQEGGRTTPANLADGRYRSVLAMGRHVISPPPAKSEAEAEQRGVFGIALGDGPSEVPPGASAIATLTVLVYRPGYTRLELEREFTILEGSRVHLHGDTSVIILVIDID